MCNKGIPCLRKFESTGDQEISRQGVYLMDSPSKNPGSCPNSASGSNDEVPRVKFLCSFLGSIMPRPQDGKLRYVGGETRIVSVSRDITYEELMGKMRELYEGAVLLKYQQPDEDLDALVSVVNDDDVTNMMEEYDKLGSVDGFTRLRIFLFSHSDQDVSSPYADGDRGSEKRYVDALNNLNDFGDYMNQSESPVLSPADDIQNIEQYFNQMNLEVGFNSQRNSDVSVSPLNLNYLKIPHFGSEQHLAAQRYNETEAPWSPAYYSPRHLGHHDSRPPPDFPASPSSSRYRLPFLEDRLPEEYGRRRVNHQAMFEHQQQLVENAIQMPSGSISGNRAGFPGNILDGPTVFEGNTHCAHCQKPFQRNQPHLEHTNLGNGYPKVPVSCIECLRRREALMFNADSNFQHGAYLKDQTESHPGYSEVRNHDRGWIPPHRFNPQLEETRTHSSVVRRSGDHNIPESANLNVSHRHGKLVDGHHLPSSYVHHQAGHEFKKVSDPFAVNISHGHDNLVEGHRIPANYLHHQVGLGYKGRNEVFDDQGVAVVPQLRISPSEEHAVRHGNSPYGHGTDRLYPAHNGHVLGHPIWRQVQSPLHVAPSYGASDSTQQVDGPFNPALQKSHMEGYLSPQEGREGQHRIEPSNRGFSFDGTFSPAYSHGHVLKVNSSLHHSECPHQYAPGPIKCQPDLPNIAKSRETVPQLDTYSTSIRHNMVPLNSEIGINAHIPGVLKLDTVNKAKEENYVKNIENFGTSDVLDVDKCHLASDKSIKSNCLEPAEGSVDAVEQVLKECSAESELPVNRLSFLPDLIASAKKAVLDEAQEVRNKINENKDSVKQVEEPEVNKRNSENAHGDPELGSNDDKLSPSKIELTKAEAEAFALGLQTINFEDLEEIRELGSGTYGSVYHGKWKGSDVAIKRIKASCFEGKPSERERLIADFWKEALILSSLHHPNVVSFYGVVRNGPDGSLATVTEFMVNGSLKQFLQKKDRTIDRRKRLIIAMDAAFGMEYLHGKNIVHFDLKCGNLLVNMRDPQRPVCKIGDLGLSKVKHQTLVSGGIRGTLPWMAPELLSGKSNMVTDKIDVYSFGIVMWELLTGEEPYANVHCATIIGGIVNNELRPQIPQWCDPEWKALMESCWATDPAQRPSFSEISQKLRSMAAAMNMK